jgi:hydrogenase maturation protein HypF
VLDERAPALLALIESGTPPVTSSMGRLFDGLAALVGVRSRVTYEAQAAIELEAWARSVPRSEAPCYPTVVDRSTGVPVLDPAPLVAAVVADLDAGVARPVIAAGIHEGLGAAAVALGAGLASAEGIDTVALSGGVFQNARLTEIIEQGLVAHGLRVLVHELVPTNDGGISLGQAAVAAATSA